MRPMYFGTVGGLILAVIAGAACISQGNGAPAATSGRSAPPTAAGSRQKNRGLCSALRSTRPETGYWWPAPTALTASRMSGTEAYSPSTSSGRWNTATAATPPFIQTTARASPPRRAGARWRSGIPRPAKRVRGWTSVRPWAGKRSKGNIPSHPRRLLAGRPDAGVRRPQPGAYRILRASASRSRERGVSRHRVVGPHDRATPPRPQRPLV